MDVTNTKNWATSWQNQQKGVSPTKTHISLSIHPVWSESSLSAWRNSGSLAIQWARNKDSNQTGWMPRLIWVFAGRTCHFVGFVMWWLNNKITVLLCVIIQTKQDRMNFTVMGEHDKFSGILLAKLWTWYFLVHNPWRFYRLILDDKCFFCFPI